MGFCEWEMLAIPKIYTRSFHLLGRVSSQEITLAPLVIEEQRNCFSYLHYLVIFEVRCPSGATSFGRLSKSSFSLNSGSLERIFPVDYLRTFLYVWTL